jgi:hypothetical protein
MILYANGCSLTEGSELGNKQFGWDEKKFGVATSRTYSALTPQHYAHMEYHAWPAVLARSLGMEVLNEGLGGSSNERIARTTISAVGKLLKTHKPEDIFVIVGWTAYERFETRHRGQWRQFIPDLVAQIQKNTTDLSPEFLDYLKKHVKWVSGDPIYNITNYLQSIISLKTFLESKKIKYVFTHSLVSSIQQYYERDDVEKAVESEELQTMFELVNFNAPNFIYAPENFTLRQLFSNVETTWFCEWSYPENPTGNGGHPLESGHAAWAKYLHDQIKMRNIL